jgi:hypothetical protein
MRFLSFNRYMLQSALLMMACAFVSNAQAIVLGNTSSLNMHVVRVVGASGAVCSGTVIDQRHVVTARHCSAVAVVIEGKYYSAANRTQNVKLSDGRMISVHGDAAILSFHQPLPSSVTPIEIGIQGIDGDFKIAGYGTTNERNWNLGKLHEASVVVHVPFKLVAPDRMSDITPSACFGDSGGAVLRNGALVGVITRASHPHPAIACGHLTHYAPVVFNGIAYAPSPNGSPVSAAPRNIPQRRLMILRGVMPR